MSTEPGQDEQPSTPQYYRPGPSSGTYPQYPQNPYPNGWAPGTSPAPYPQQPSPAPQAPAPEQAPHQQPSGPYPAWPGGTGSSPQPATRPTQVRLALVLLLLSALPFVLMGVVAMRTTIDQATLDGSGIPRALAEQALTNSGFTFEALTTAVRVMGGVFVVLALVYAVVAFVAFRGSSGARFVLVVLTVVYGIPLLLMMAPTLPSFAVAILALAAVGIWLLFTPAARTWYDARSSRPSQPGAPGAR
ncbi:hypothetical protein [Pseudonocardia phyllosphaerae]|uniref:hypothetical protein n=1 Tax=Pseudonocardia phyllosphaerae TaxID=3390502 RepID=UPI00397BCA17